MKAEDLNLWTGSRTRHLGYFFARSFKLSRKLLKLLSFWFFVLLLALPLASLACFLLSSESRPLTSSFIYASTLIYGLLLIPGLSLYSLFKYKSRLLSLDIGVSALSLFFFANLLNEGRFPFKEAIIAQLCLLAYLLARTFGSFFELRQHSDQTYRLSPGFVSELIKCEAKSWRKIIVTGLAFAAALGGLYYYFPTNRFLDAKLIALSSLAFLFPWSNWVYVRLGRQFSDLGIQLKSLRILHDLQRIRHLRLHSLGVLAKQELGEPEFYFDPSSAWDETEIKELLKALVSSSVHPLCRSIQTFAGQPKAVRWEVENLPYIGLKTNFRGNGGKLHELFLCSYQWLATQKHEFSPEMLRQLKVWEDDARVISFVSVDSRIVLGIAARVEAKEDLEVEISHLCDKGFDLSLWSSGARTALPPGIQNFKEVSTNLLPLEREVQALHWKERQSECISVMAAWDPSEDGIKIIYQDDDTQELRDEEVHIWHSGLRSLRVLFDEAKLYRHQKLEILLGPVKLAAVSLILGAFTTFWASSAFLCLAYMVAAKRYSARFL